MPSQPSGFNEMSIRRFFDEVFVKGKVKMIDELVDPKFIEHEVLPGIPPTREGLKQFVTQLRTAFPDLKATIADITSQGDKVWARATFTGTHKGTFMQIPATGKKVAFEAIDVVRFSGGKSVEHWGLTDGLGLLTQLGAIPPPGQSRGR